MMMRLQPYIRIARFDHWFKHVFMLPGVAVALYGDSSLINAELLWRLPLALLCAGLISSSYYILNEILDAPYDALHPVKKHRPVPSGQINVRLALLLLLILVLAGVNLAVPLGLHYCVILLILWFMGLAYNVRPLRTKDRVYLDVLSESINNPLRLLLGWYATGNTMVVPVSLIVAYWMLGAFLMAMKRYAEFRELANPQLAAAYRRSFASYTESTLLVSIVYYAAAFGLFLGIFLIRYRIELILAIPFIAGFIAWYMHLGLKANSPTQSPEYLHREKRFVSYLLFCLFLTALLMFVDMPMLEQIFAPTLDTPDTAAGS